MEPGSIFIRGQAVTAHCILIVALLRHFITKSCKRAAINQSLRLLPPAANCGGSGSPNGQEKSSKTEGDAGPSCSSSSKDAGDTKSKFFDDSEESEEGEEEGSDEEVRTSHQSKCDMKDSMR